MSALQFDESISPPRVRVRNKLWKLESPRTDVEWMSKTYTAMTTQFIVENQFVLAKRLAVCDDPRLRSSRIGQCL